MSVGVPNFVGARLEEARLARGLFRKTLGDMVGVSGTAIGRYESGADKPQRERLDALARSLSFPVDFFLRPAWPETIDGVFWRSRTSETKSAREMTEQRMRWICEMFNALEQDVDFPPLDLPTLDVPAEYQMITPEVIERAAEDLRAHWGLRLSPIPDVILALENAGIPVATLDIVSDKQDGFCFGSAQLRRIFVGINTYQVSCVRGRFDAAHELGHAVLHRHVPVSLRREVTTHRILEQQAHRFAGAFLFPRASFISEVAVPSLDYFCALKKRWKMSIGAMVFRAYDLGIIDDADKAALFQNMQRRRWRGPLREPFDSLSEMPLEQPRMLRRAVEAVVGSGIFGRQVLASSLALPHRELEQIAALPEGYLMSESAEVVRLPRVRSEQPLRAVDLETGNVLTFPKRAPG